MTKRPKEILRLVACNKLRVVYRITTAVQFSHYPLSREAFILPLPLESTPGA